ncbi:hypothetical protein E2C01_068194 [Portunus trituberculatus]|uniref:Reverse transcriptase domain-containing protein n=1 Tax=Portunus trituberculatus TaxID=210409 RepID=A0A5B7HZE4_PORTR|nr:hypothetical protein [Portunus trituberculatus]
MKHHPWTEVLDVEDVHTKSHNYVTSTTEAFHRYFPAKSITEHSSDAPWMKPRMKRLICWRKWAFHSCPVQYRKGSMSSFQQFTCGVLQSTKMGPLCFLLLVNSALTNIPHRWKYVDDCTMGVPINNKDSDYSVLQATLEKLQVWTEESSMTINHSKTVVMKICTSSDTVRPAANRLYMLRRLKSLRTPADELRGVYLIFIFRKLMYAFPAWSSSLNSTQQQQLENEQKRTCRAGSSSALPTPTTTTP